MTSDLRALLARHPAPWKEVGYEEFGYEWVEGANGVEVFDDGTAGGEYGRTCKPETMDLIVSAVNALPGLLDEVDRLRSKDAQSANELAALRIQVSTIRAMLTTPPLDTALVGIRRVLGIEDDEPETEGGGE